MCSGASLSSTARPPDDREGAEREAAGVAALEAKVAKRDKQRRAQQDPLEPPPPPSSFPSWAYDK